MSWCSLLAHKIAVTSSYCEIVPRSWTRLLAHCAGTDRRFVPYNGAVGAKQLEWLRGELQEAAAAGDRVIVAAHVPLHPEASDSSALLWNFPEVLAELYGEHGSKCVVAVLAGEFVRLPAPHRSVT